MYHYVRKVKKSNYPNLNALEFDDFKNQILYFKKNFNILDNEQFNEIIQNKKISKKPSVVLTFDDGYIDHYNYVYPYLKKNKISGIFYTPIKTIENKVVLDVNKIQFILEKENNKNKVLNLIFYYIKKVFKKNPEELSLSKINVKDRYNDKETMLIKNLLQYHLPKKIRKKIINLIFKDILNVEEKEFSKSLYMNKNHIIEMYKDSMAFGSHGYNHDWLGYLNKKDQEKEILSSINFFKKIGTFNSNFSICYPFGSYNEITLKILKKHNIPFALSAKVGGVVKNNIGNNLTLPRYDTTDFI